MSLEKLVGRIAEDAARESDFIESAALEKAEQILSQAKGEAESLAREKISQAERETAMETRRSIAIANLEVRKDILELKRSMIERAFDSALERLKGLPQKQYLSLMKEMLLSAVESGDEEVILSPEDRSRLGKALVSEVNKELKSTGKAEKLKLSKETRNIEGGFILRKGGVEVNQSLEAILEAKKEELEPEIVSTLWG